MFPVRPIVLSVDFPDFFNFSIVDLQYFANHLLFRDPFSTFTLSKIDPSSVLEDCLPTT